MDLIKENEILKNKLEQFKKAATSRSRTICIHCMNPIPGLARVSVTAKDHNDSSKTVGHLHIKCWNILMDRHAK